MGGCLSSVSGAPKHVIEFVDGNEDEYHKRYLEGQSLGEGQFGVVKMVHDVTSTQEGKPLACKILRKGAILKDNVFYGPIKSEVLKGEIDILRTLAGLHYCLRFHGIYESPRALYMITDYCGGGQMMEYVSKLQVDLTSEDVSRVSYQLLSALNHCCKHHVIHRDIKPENIMFHVRT
jgi:serine/threonine protein kinase